MLQIGATIPNLYLGRTDGTGMQIWDLWQKSHGLLLLVNDHFEEMRAFASHFQGDAKTFEWLKLQLLVVYPKPELVPSPWPAPDFSPFVYSEPLPDGLEWNKGYAFTHFRKVFEIYSDLGLLAVSQVEKDVTYWEARHC